MNTNTKLTGMISFWFDDSKNGVNDANVRNATIRFLEFNDHDGTVTYDCIVKYLLPIVIYTVAFYLLIFSIYRAKLCNNEKKLSWVITLVNSFLMSTAGFVYLSYILITHPNTLLIQSWDISSIPIAGETKSIFNRVDNFSTVVCTLFACANIIDLVIGRLFYKDQDEDRNAVIQWIAVAELRVYPQQLRGRVLSESIPGWKRTADVKKNRSKIFD